MLIALSDSGSHASRFVVSNRGLTKEHDTSRITNFAGGTAKDLNALGAIFEEAAAIVERDLPGTLVYQILKPDCRTVR